MSAAPADEGRYAFGGYEVDVGAREIRRGDGTIPVEPQVFDVLVVLLRERHRVVSKEELLDEVWGTRMVGESALTTRIKALRKALGDDGRSQSKIRTAHSRGFRFVAAIEDPRPPHAPTMPSTREVPGDSSTVGMSQSISFCRAADGTRLAYATMGEGPPLVKVANWLTHLEYDLESPVWRHWYRELAQRFTVLRHDERWCGLSELDVDDFSVDVWVRDLEAVVDAAGFERFPLFGISQGGAVAVEYARRHPDRVSHLVLYGAFVKGPLLHARRPEHQREAAMLPELASLGWGRRHPILRQVLTQRFLPFGPAELWEAFDQLMVRSTAATNAARFLRAFNVIDVEDAARELDVPTLVIHARRDMLIPFSQSLGIAAMIRGSRFVSLDRPNHLLLETEPAWPILLDHLDSFFAQTQNS